MQLIIQALNVLVVSLCKPVIIHKLKILGGGKHEYYKSMGGTTKRGDQILKFQGGEQKRGVGTIFDSNLVGGNLGGNYGIRSSCFDPGRKKENGAYFL